MALVYKATNLRNEKMYIGMTVRSLEARKNAHLSAARNNNQCRFHHALRKYNEEDFKWEILHEDLPKEEALELEEVEILKHKSHVSGIGYNGNTGKCGGYVIPDSKYDRWISKLREANAGKNNSKYCGVTDNEIINECVRIALKNGKILSLSKVRRLSSVYIPKSFSNFRFNGGGLTELYKRIEEKTGFKYNPYERSEEYRHKIGNTIRGRKWYTNGLINKQCEPGKEPEGFILGRTISKRKNQ